MCPALLREAKAENVMTKTCCFAKIAVKEQAVSLVYCYSLDDDQPGETGQTTAGLAASLRRKLKRASTIETHAPQTGPSKRRHGRCDGRAPGGFLFVELWFSLTEGAERQFDCFFIVTF